MNEYQQEFRERHMLWIPLRIMPQHTPRALGDSLFRRRHMWNAQVERFNHHTRIVCLQRGLR